MITKIFISVLSITSLIGGILFSAAGRLDWMAAWTFIALYGIGLLCIMLWGTAQAPDLMRERSRMSKNVKPWDKAINLLYALTLVATLVVAGLDAGRFGWSQIPQILQGFGGVGCVFAGYVIWLTMKENAFLSRWARIQADRGQNVVSSGPYRILRHPMYAAILLFVLCMTFLLGSWWAFIPAGIVMALFILRTLLEDQMLHEELSGYREYARSVRYRLFPGVW